VLAAAGIAWVAGPGPIRVGALLFGLLCVAAFVVPSPVGGNAVRLGTLAVAPLAFHFLWPHRKVALALLALPIAYWVLQPAARDALRTVDDPSVERAFHRPLVDFLATKQPARVEIAFTQNHWEARWVAAKLPIARGWERQVDRERNALFYADDLDPAEYEAWLRENAIAHVAVPQRVPLDASAEEEAVLAQSGVPFLREERAGLKDWRVFAVVDPASLVTGPARLTRMGADSFTLDFARPGKALVKVHYTPYWRVKGGCVREGSGTWTEVEAKQAGTVEVETQFALGRVSRTGSSCHGG
jgi:hypothetical protein